MAKPSKSLGCSWQLAPSGASSMYSTKNMKVTSVIRHFAFLIYQGCISCNAYVFHHDIYTLLLEVHLEPSNQVQDILQICSSCSIVFLGANRAAVICQITPNRDSIFHFECHVLSVGGSIPCWWVSTHLFCWLPLSPLATISIFVVCWGLCPGNVAWY